MKLSCGGFISQKYSGKYWVFISLLHLSKKNNGYFKVWENTHIESLSRLNLNEGVSINRGCILHCGGGISIGKNTLIGPNVIIYSQTHNFRNKDVLIKNQGYKRTEVVIGENTWIGAGCIILPGVNIADNVVIAAGSLVSTNIPNNRVFLNKRTVSELIY